MRKERLTPDGRFVLYSHYDLMAGTERYVVRDDLENAAMMLRDDESIIAQCKKFIDAQLAKTGGPIGTQLRITGLVRAKLPPGWSIHPHRQGEFYLRDSLAHIDYALMPGHEAVSICKYLNINLDAISQGEFDGEYRRATAQVRSPAPQARASFHAGQLAGHSPIALAQFAAAFAPTPAARKRASLDHPVIKCEPRVGELIAHRAWFWDAERKSLTSVGYWPLEWEPQKPMRDITLFERNPDFEGRSYIHEHNYTGVWSFKNPNGPIHEYLLAGGSGRYAWGTADSHKLMLVLGTCYIWGTIIEHEHGYRSQFGAIRSLDSAYFIQPAAYDINTDHIAEPHWHPHRDETFLDALRVQYKLPVLS